MREGIIRVYYNQELWFMFIPMKKCNVEIKNSNFKINNARNEKEFKRRVLAFQKHFKITFNYFRIGLFVFTLVPPLCGPHKSSALALSYFRPSPQSHQIHGS